MVLLLQQFLNNRLADVTNVCLQFSGGVKKDMIVSRRDSHAALEG